MRRFRPHEKMVAIKITGNGYASIIINQTCSKIAVYITPVFARDMFWEDRVAIKVGKIYRDLIAFLIAEFNRAADTSGVSKS
tara:strand:- start:2861 stop:3106 length:246 start_codon:yes stop_codon:yes gene_type:complete